MKSPKHMFQLHIKSIKCYTKLNLYIYRCNSLTIHQWLRTIESEGVFTSEVYTILDVLSHITSQDDYLIIRREVRYGTDFYNFAFVFLHDRNCLCVYLTCNNCDIISLQCCKKCKVFWTTCWQTSLVQN